MRLIIGGTIAIMLLGLYAYSVLVAVFTVTCVTTSGCTDHTVADFGSGFSFTLTTVGGLISALVITELAITMPGEIPMSRTFDANPSPQAMTALKWVTGAYMVVWLLLGILSYVVGVMQHPNVVPILTDAGNSWMGIAISAAYIYLGVKPKT